MKKASIRKVLLAAILLPGGGIFANTLAGLDIGLDGRPKAVPPLSEKEMTLNSPKRILVIYFTRSGCTRQLAASYTRSPAEIFVEIHTFKSVSALLPGNGGDGKKERTTACFRRFYLPLKNLDNQLNSARNAKLVRTMAPPV